LGSIRHFAKANIGQAQRAIFRFFNPILADCILKSLLNILHVKASTRRDSDKIVCSQNMARPAIEVSINFKNEPAILVRGRKLGHGVS